MIEVVIDIDKENQELYGFNLFDLTAVFVRYHKQVKPKGKRKWTSAKFWNKYMERESNIVQPELPQSIKELAHQKVQELIKVKTWSEWKSN